MSSSLSGRPRDRLFQIGRLAFLAAVGALLAGPHPCAGAEGRLRFKHLTVEDGLASAWVRCVVKDRRGFLWVGTSDGLNRYDGSRLVRYRHERDDPHSLASSDVWALFEDGRQRLWVGTAGGLCLYDRRLDRFERRSLGDDDVGPGPARVTSAIRQDHQGQLWVGTMRGLCRYDPETGRARRFVHDPDDAQSLIHDAVNSLDVDSQGRVWVGTRGGLDCYDVGAARFAHPASLLARPSGRGGADSIGSIYCAPDGIVWIATHGRGLLRLEPKDGQLREFRSDPADKSSLNGDRVLRVTGDGKASLYVGLENDGLDVLDLGTGRFTHHLSDPDDPTALSNPSVWSLAVDDQGILWVGTFNGGLNYHLPLAQNFEVLRAGRGALSDPHVTSIIEDHLGGLWVGTDGGGLNHLDRRTGRVTRYRHDPRDSGSLPSNAVLALLEDREGGIWIGTWAGGVARLDPRSGRMLRLNAELNLPNEPVNMGVWAIVEDSQGRLLIGTERSGVMVFNRRKGSVAPLAKTQPPAGATGSVRVIAEDRRGDLWLGRATELESAGIHFVQVLNRETGRVAEYRNEPGNAASLAPGTIFAIHPDSRDNVWVGTAGGLTCIAADRRTLRTYGPADGLPAEVVASILEDQAGNLWLGTTRGLVRFKGAARQPERLVVNVYDENDGLPGNEFRGGAAFRSRSGEMFFGGPRGVTLFYPDRVRENPFAPPVVLTDLRLFNRSVGVGTLDSPLSAAIWETQALLLQPDQSVLTFEFAALNYTLSRKNRYAYRLEGLEPVWNEAGTRTSATYTSLRHGEYVFRVRAANNDGVWNENGVALRIRVAPRWHERPVVRLGIAACLALAACAGFLWRERQSRRRERELERRVDDRTAELQRLNQELEERVSSRTSELAAEKERLAVTLRSIADAVVATDIEGRVVLVNRVAEELSGWSAAEAWGRPLKEVLPLHDRESRAPLPDPAGSVLRGERVLGLSLEALLVRRDGREILIADSVAPIRDQASRVVGAVLVFRDVTERRRIEEQLQSSEKLEALGVLAGGIAHDFNNLLTGVFGYIDLAQKRDADHEKRHVILNKALAVLNKARGLTGQLLTFSRSEQPVTAPLALGVLIKESVEFALSGANVSCDVHVPDDLWPCRGDEHQIDQVIDNLLLNARQAMPQGGRIDLTASNVVVPDEASVPVADGRYVCIRVQDRGPGIASDLRGRIFEPFFTTKPAGTGLGLATSYSIVRKHGGHIEVESEVGRGSAFCVYLPASSEPVRPRGGASGEAPPRGVGRVLVLDDEDYVRDVAREILEGLGYTVECAATGEEALALHAAAQACSTPFDLVILDLTVPGGMGGVAVLQRMRAVDPRVVAVASSGYSVDSVMTDPGTHGFAGRLTKPYVTAEMGAVVARVLARRQPRSS